jgi:Phospholipase_D-nuclease N-terminal
MGTVLWITLSVLVVIVWLIGVVDIFRRRLSVMHTIAWLLIVLILPLLGTILYWVLRQPEPGELERTEAAERDIRRSRRDRPFDSTGFGV